VFETRGKNEGEKAKKEKVVRAKEMLRVETQVFLEKMPLRRKNKKWGKKSN
jgi:hypothetical protein